jgi:hypothetical protein
MMNYTNADNFMIRINVLENDKIEMKHKLKNLDTTVSIMVPLTAIAYVILFIMVLFVGKIITF